MPMPQMETVEPIIGQYQSIVLTSYLTAWHEWRESDFIGVWTDRSRASYIWEQTTLHMRRMFVDCPDVRIFNKNKTFLFLLHNEVCFRVKKGDAAGLGRNISTRSVRIYNDPQQTLPGIPDVQRVEITYKVNKEGTEIVDILVVASSLSDISRPTELIVRLTSGSQN